MSQRNAPRPATLEKALRPYIKSEVRDADKEFMRAMGEQDPACLGDQRFTADKPRGPRGSSPLAEVCAQCPLFEACGQYADAIGPVTGFWAGQWYPKPRAARGPVDADARTPGARGAPAPPTPTPGKPGPLPISGSVRSPEALQTLGKVAPAHSGRSQSTEKRSQTSENTDQREGNQ